MKNSRPFQKWESQARQFFGDAFWEDILTAIPQQGENTVGPEAQHSPGRPAVDVYKTERQVVVHVELPGLSNLNGVDVYLQGESLVVSGHLLRRFSREQTVQAERFAGDFKRVIPLPVPVEEEGIQAKYVHGLLEVTLQRLRKRREERRKRIQIQRGPET